MNCKVVRLSFLLLGTCWLVGCGTKPTAYGVAQNNISWTTTDEGPNAVPGIASASVSHIILKAGPPQGVPFVIWSDLADGNSGSGSGKAGRAEFRGQHRGRDGRKIEFHAVTTDGTSGTLKVAGLAYDLSKGSLLLISTRADPPRIVQIECDHGAFPRSREDLIRFAKSREEIRKFFEEPEK